MDNNSCTYFGVLVGGRSNTGAPFATEYNEHVVAAIVNDVVGHIVVLCAVGGGYHSNNTLYINSLFISGASCECLSNGHGVFDGHTGNGVVDNGNGVRGLALFEVGGCGGLGGDGGGAGSNTGYLTGCSVNSSNGVVRRAVYSLGGGSLCQSGTIDSLTNAYLKSARSERQTGACRTAGNCCLVCYSKNLNGIVAAGEGEGYIFGRAGP